MFAYMLPMRGTSRRNPSEIDGSNTLSVRLLGHTEACAPSSRAQRPHDLQQVLLHITVAWGSAGLPKARVVQCVSIC